VEGNYLKDLNVMRDRDLARTVLVDNSPHAFGYQLDNGIPIESWFDDPEDRELLKLERFLLTKILPAPDVRPVVRAKFRVHELVAAAPPLSPSYG
jgi:CTD small phosphatase-like protein 2